MATVEKTTLRDHIREQKELKRANQERWFAIVREAERLGVQAGNTAIPEAMIVYTPQSLFDNTPRLDEPVYHVPDGVCGFAWVHLYAVKGQEGQEARKFINWLTGTQSPCEPRLSPPIKCDKAYGGGHWIWIHDHRQSMERKVAHAAAMADYLREHVPGLKAYPQSRMD